MQRLECLNQYLFYMGILLFPPRPLLFTHSYCFGQCSATTDLLHQSVNVMLLQIGSEPYKVVDFHISPLNTLNVYF